jgi:hypothetical protein
LTDSGVIVIGAALAPADRSALERHVERLILDRSIRLLVCDVRAVCEPDLDVIDTLARVALVVRRSGGRTCLRGASGELRGLLWLVGLSDVLPCEGSVEVGG